MNEPYEQCPPMIAEVLRCIVPDPTGMPVYMDGCGTMIAIPGDWNRTTSPHMKTTAGIILAKSIERLIEDYEKDPYGFMRMVQEIAKAVPVK